jgi:putative colanic acid biosynthesis UDP-glucose lipid carrier transferase
MIADTILKTENNTIVPKKTYLSLEKNINYQLTKILLFIAFSALYIVLFRLEVYSRTVFLGTIVLFSVFKIVSAIITYYYLRVRNDPNMAPILIVGYNDTSNRLYQYFKERPHLGLDPIGIIDDNIAEDSASEVPILGKLDEFLDVYEKHPFNEVLISLSLDDRELIKSVTDLAENNGIKVRMFPTYLDEQSNHMSICRIGDVSLLCMRRLPLDAYPHRFWKRASDIVLSSIGLILLSPIFFLIAILIKLDSKGPVFYKPIRLGVNNKPFVMFKFRTMKQNDDNVSGTKSTQLNDDRITRVGKFLRRFSLDELPQLINVFWNDMSIVGPRPHRIYLNKQLKARMKYYMVRHYVKPGITGWAQVNGWRGPTETKVQYFGRTLHDLWYIEHWSFLLDIYIIVLTFFGKKTKKNAF